MQLFLCIVEQTISPSITSRGQLQQVLTHRQTILKRCLDVFTASSALNMLSSKFKINKQKFLQQESHWLCWLVILSPTPICSVALSWKQEKKSATFNCCFPKDETVNRPKFRKRPILQTSQCTCNFLYTAYIYFTVKKNKLYSQVSLTTE